MTEEFRSAKQAKLTKDSPSCPDPAESNSAAAESDTAAGSFSGPNSSQRGTHHDVGSDTVSQGIQVPQPDAIPTVADSFSTDRQSQKSPSVDRPDHSGSSE